MFTFLKRKKNTEKHEIRIIKADNIHELTSLVKAEQYFDAFDFELYYKIKKIKNED